MEHSDLEPRKINLVLDLDNTILSSVSFKELGKMHDKKEYMEYQDMENYYRVFSRPYLQEFLDYVFKFFDVTVWTAASRDYALFIVENILLPKGEYKSNFPQIHKKGRRHLKMLMCDKNCDESQKHYSSSSPKDLRYLYHFQGYHPCNTVIMDDLFAVYSSNKDQTLRAKYFDIKDSSASKDDFLLHAITALEKIRREFNKNPCIHTHHITDHIKSKVKGDKK